MEGSDIVFHQAAQPGVRYSIEHPLESHGINVTGTLNVLLAAKELKIPKVIFASSSSVYGVPRSLPISEDHPTNPNSPYAVSKLAAEKYCKVFSEVYGLEVVMLRYFSVYGPRGRPDQVIKSFVDRVALGLPPVIFGDGGQTRDFTYVSDVVDANILAAEREGVSGEVFNVGFGRRVEIKKLAEMVIDLMGKTGEISPTYEKSYAGDFPDTCADVAKASRMLGYAPRVDLNEGLKRFISWYRVNSKYPQNS
jgi:UDP-glucose 4-epimerase